MISLTLAALFTLACVVVSFFVGYHAGALNAPSKTVYVYDPVEYIAIVTIHNSEDE